MSEPEYGAFRVHVRALDDLPIDVLGGGELALSIYLYDEHPDDPDHIPVLYFATSGGRHDEEIAIMARNVATAMDMCDLERDPDLEGMRYRTLELEDLDAT